MTGQDGLRDDIAAALVEQRLGLEWDEIEDYERDEYRADADAVLPIVQARIGAAREQVAEQIIEAIRVRREHYIACGAPPRYTAGMYEAIGIIQKLAKEAAP